MRTRRRFSVWLSIAMLAGAEACERSTSPGPGAGLTSSRLVSPHADDGAAFIELTGDVQAVTAPEGTTVYTEQVRPGVLRVLLVRETPGPIAFSLMLADRARTPVVRVLDVADGLDRPRASVDGYRVEF